MEFISAVIAASGLKEFASIQITGNRKNMESTSKITASIQLNVFCFFNDIKYKTTTGFNSLIICAKSSDAEYSNITFSKIIYFDKIKYLKYSGTNIDDIFILEKMQNLEELSLEISDNDTFYKAKSIAKKMGITIHIT